MKVKYFISGGFFNTFGVTAEPTGRWYTVTGNSGTTLYIEFKCTKYHNRLSKSHKFDIFGWFDEHERVEYQDTKFVDEYNIRWYIESDVQGCNREQG